MEDQIISHGMRDLKLIMFSQSKRRRIKTLSWKKNEKKCLEEIILEKVIQNFCSTNCFFSSTTFALDRVEGRWTAGRPSVNFQNIPLVRDVTYQKPIGNYATDAAVDITQGRRVVRPEILIPKVKKMLGEAADYIDENHLEMKEPDWKHGQTINRLLHTMSYMGLNSFEQVYDSIKDSKSPAGITMK